MDRIITIGTSSIRFQGDDIFSFLGKDEIDLITPFLTAFPADIHYDITFKVIQDPFTVGHSEAWTSLRQDMLSLYPVPAQAVINEKMSVGERFVPLMDPEILRNWHHYLFDASYFYFIALKKTERKGFIFFRPQPRRFEHVFLHHVLLSLFDMIATIAQRAFILHSSSVAIDKEAYVFIGAPEAGKSTVASLLDHSTQLSDDHSIIEKNREGTYNVYATPWWTNDSVSRYGLSHGRDTGRLSGIFLVRKSDHSSCTRLSFKSALKVMLDGKRCGQKSIMFTIIEYAKWKYTFLSDLLRSVPFFLLDVRRHSRFKDEFRSFLSSFEAGS